MQNSLLNSTKSGHSMTSVFKIHDTVLQVTYEAQTLLPKMKVMRSENKLLAELALCILSSQEKYEIALAVIKFFRKQNILRVPESKTEFKEIKSQIRKTLKNPVVFNYKGKEYSRRLRFFTKKTEYIIGTLDRIYLNDLTIKEILKQDKCIQQTRKNIMNYSHGLGPKQASMFLRNVGYYSEFAVLDKHIIDYMRIMGLNSGSAYSFSSISTYQKIEAKLNEYAESFNVKLFHLDLAIWTTMRTINTNKS